jgi:hypothetical protein
MADPNEKMNIVDSASLTFFTNPLYYNILQRKKLCNVKDNTEEVKFYRKRIIALFKEMLKEPSNENENREIKELHTMFVNASIRYFEIIDTKDIVQCQHQHQVEHKEIGSNDASSIVESDNLTPDELLDAIVDCEGDNEITSINEANDIMMRKTITIPNLDNYVINTTASNQTNAASDRRIIPLKIEIDLKTHDLKTKGVPPKKNHKSKYKKEDLSS